LDKHGDVARLQNIRTNQTTQREVGPAIREICVAGYSVVRCLDLDGNVNRNGKTRSRRRSASRVRARAFSKSLSETIPTSLREPSLSTTGKRVSPVSAMR